MPESGIGYSLRVKIRIDDTDLNKAHAAVLKLGNIARGAAKSVEGVDGAFGKLGLTVAAVSKDAIAGAAAIKTQYGSAAMGIREARREAGWLDDAIKKVAASTQNYGKINAKVTGGRRSAFPSAPSIGGSASPGQGWGGSSSYVFGGGMASTILGGLGGLAGGPVGSVAGAVAGSALSMGTGAAGGALGYVVSLGREAEITRSGIASLYMSIEHMDARAASQMARGTFKALSADAARGVGQMSDYSTAYTSMYAPVRQSGGSDGDIRELTRLSLATGYALRGREGLWQAPLDVTQALTGGVGDRTTPIALAALRASGKSAEDYRAASPEDQLKMLLEGFRAFTPAIKAMGETFDAQAETLADKGRQFTRALSEPMFEKVRLGLLGFNASMDMSQPQIDVFAQSLGILSGTVGDVSTRMMAFAADFIRGGTGSAATYRWASAGQGADLAASQFGIGSLTGESLGSAASSSAAGVVNAASRSAGIAALMTRTFFRNKAALLGLAEPVQDFEFQNQFDALTNTTVRPDGAGKMPWERTDEAVDPLVESQNKLKEALDELRKTGSKVKIEIPDFRVEWGNDRQAAESIRAVLEYVAERASIAQTESSMLDRF